MHAVRSLLVTEREGNLGGSAGQPPSLLVGAGLPLAWLDGGGEVAGTAMPTWFGSLSLRFRREAESGAVGAGAGASGPRVVVNLEEASPRPGASAGDAPRRFDMPAGGIEVAAPFGADVATATVDGAAAAVDRGSVRVARLPATVVFQYKPRLEKPS